MENWVKRLTSSPLTREELGTLMQEADRQNKKGEIPWITLVKKLVKKLAKCGSQVLLHNISKVIRSHMYQPMKGERELAKKEAAHLLEAYSSLITYINHSLEESDLSVREISRLTSVILPAVIDMNVLSVRKGKSDVAQSIYNKITLLLGESSGLIADTLLHCRTLIFTKLRDPEIFVPIIRLFFTSVKRNKSELHSISPELYLKYLVLGKFWLFMSPREEVSSVRTYIFSLLKMPPSFEEWSSQANISWLQLETFTTKSVLKAMVISTALQTVYSKRHGPQEKKTKQKVGKHSGNVGQMRSSLVDDKASRTEEGYHKDLNKEEEESVKSVRDKKDKTQNRKSESQKEKRKTFDGTSDVVCETSKKKKCKVVDTESESGICKGLEEEKMHSHGSSNLLENSAEEVSRVGTLGKEAKAKLKKKKKPKLKESMNIEGENEECEMSSDRKKQDSALELENNSSLIMESLEFKRNSEVLGSLEVKQMNDPCEEVDEGKVKRKKKLKHKQCANAERVGESEMGDKSNQRNTLEVKNVSVVKGGVILKSFETEGNKEMQLSSCEGEHKIEFREESKEGRVKLKKKSKHKKSLNTEIPEGNDKENPNDNSEAGNNVGMEFREQKENSKMDANSMSAEPVCQLGNEMAREKVKLKKKKKNKTKEGEVIDDEKSLNDVCESEGAPDILESLESKNGSDRLHTFLTEKQKSTSKSAKTVDKEVKLKKKKKGKEVTLNIEGANKSKMSDDTKHSSSTCESPNILVSKGSERLEALELEEKVSLNTFAPKQESEFDKGNKLKQKKKVQQKNTLHPEKANEDSEVVCEGKSINGKVELENTVISKKTGKKKKGEQKDTICPEIVNKEVGISERTNSKNALPGESGKILLIASEKSSIEAPFKVKKSKALKKKNNEVCELQESETVASDGKGAPPANKKKKTVEKCEALAPIEQNATALDIASQTRKKRRKKKMSVSLDESQSYDSDSKQAPYKEPKMYKSENTGKQSGISVLKQNSHISAAPHDNIKNIEDKVLNWKDKIPEVSQSHQKRRKKLDLGIENLDEELEESSGHPDKRKKKRRRSAVERDNEIECKVSSLESESSLLHDKGTQLDGSGTPCAKKPRIDKGSLLELAEGKDIHKKKKFLRKMISLMLSNTDQEIQLRESILTTLTGKGEKVTSMTGKQTENKSKEQKHSKEKQRILKKQDKVLSSIKDKASVSYEDVPKEHRGWSLSPPHSRCQKERLRTSSWNFTVTKFNLDISRDAALALVEGSPKESVQSKSDEPSKNTDSIEKLPCQIVASPKAETSFAKSNDNDSDLDIIYHQTDVEAVSDSSDEIDEASGSPGDIVPCDEVNKMFTDEETRVYHEKLLKANMPKGSGALMEREKRLTNDCTEEASQLSITEYEPIQSDNEEGLKAILETIVRDTGRKSSIEGLKEYVFSSSSSDVVVLSEKNDNQEPPSLEEGVKKDMHERENLSDNGSTASSVTRQLSNGSDSTELPCVIEAKPIQEVQSISDQDKEDVGKYAALNSATLQKEPIKPRIDAGCNDNQETIASCRNSQSESKNEILRVNSKDMQTVEQVQVPCITNGLENGGYSSVDVHNDEILNSSSSKGDTDVDYSVCISGKPNDDTREKAFLGNVLIEKSNELRELNIEAQITIHDSCKNSGLKESDDDNGAQTDLQDSPRNSKLEDIDIVEESNLQDLSKSNELEEKDIDVGSYLQDSPKNSKMEEIDIDEGSNLQYSPKSGEGKDLYIDAKRKNVQDLPKNSELEIHTEAENNLQDSPKNLFALRGKDASDAQGKKRETPSKLKTTLTNLSESLADRDLDTNESMDYINLHANTTNSTADDFHKDSPNKKIDFERTPDGDAGINLQNKSNFAFSEGVTQWEVCKSGTVGKYLRNDSTVVTDKEKETDLEIQNNRAPLSPNGIEVVASVKDSVTEGYKPENTLTPKGDQDKLSESYENVLCNDGDEAYEASSDASEEPTPVSRRKTRSQRKPGPLLLKTDEASDSDFSPLRRSQRGLTLKESQKVTGGDAEVDISETSYTKAGKECSPSESDDVGHHNGVLASDVESVKRFSLSRSVPLKKIERRRSKKSYSSSKEFEISPMQVKTRRMRRQCFSESEMGSYCVERGFLDKVRRTRKTKYSSSVDKDGIVLLEGSLKEKILVDAASPSKRMATRVQRSLIPVFSEGCQKEVDTTDRVTASLIMDNENKGSNNTSQDSALQNGHCSHSTDKNTKSSLSDCSVTSDGQKVSERIEDFDDEQVCLDENKEEEAYSFRELLDEEEGDEIEVLSTSGLGDSEDGLECNVAIVNKKAIKKYKASGKPACVSKKLQQNYSQRKSNKQSPLGKKSEPFTFTNKDSDKLEIPQLKAQCVSEAVLAKEVLISPDVSDEECELVLPSDAGGSEMKKNASSSEGLCELLKKLPEDSKIGIKPWSRRGGIRSPQKVIPEEQDETSFSRKKSSPNKVQINSSDTGKSSDEDIQNLGHSSEILPRRSDRRLSVGGKSKSVKSSNCNHSSMKNVRCGAEATEEESSKTQDKYTFGSKRRKREDADGDEGSSSARVTRSGVKKTGTPSIVSPSKKDPCTLLTESMSDSSDKGDSPSVKSDYSPRILRSRRASKNSASSVTLLKKRENRVLKKGVTDESNSSDSNEKYSRCKKLVLDGPESITQKDDGESEKEGSGEISSSSEKRNRNTVNMTKSSTRLQSRTRCGDKVSNVLTSPVKAGIHSEHEEKAIVGIEKNKSTGTKNLGVSEKRQDSRSQNKEQEQKLSPVKRRTRLSCAKHVVDTKQEERQQTQQEIASQSGISQAKIIHRGKITSLPHSSEESEVSPLQKLPQEPSHPPLPEVAQYKTTTTEISSPLKDSSSKTSAIVVSSPSPTKTIKEITFCSKLAQEERPDPPKESPNQPIGRRTRRAQLMPNEAKNAGVSSS